ncbi:MAG: carboxylating nicotinate-nucleotide diphosphorylase, partial [Bacteroidales bacterium]|nr:carboxylating nicotinate-nucleotide diphosphorylase [Bacteroidales bacterium]
QRMSGIATQTDRYVGKIKDLHTKILDTRKTTPGMRILDKEAVRIGGGENHRMGLYDMIMLKDNHIDFAGGITQAIRKTNEYLDRTGKALRIEVEARGLEDVKEIMQAGHVHRIMLDNFSIADTRKALELIEGRYETESSGKITLDNLRDYAECGVDYISVGALTHQIKSLDLSLKASY